jgi:hypothetical protein
MLRKAVFVALSALATALFAAPEAHAWGGCHFGYTHVGYGGVQHYGYTAARGPYGGYSGGHYGSYGSYDGYHAGYGEGYHYGSGGAYGGYHAYTPAYGGGYAAGGYHYGYANPYGYSAGVYRAY